MWMRLFKTFPPPTLLIVTQIGIPSCGSALKSEIIGDGALTETFNGP